MKRAHYLSGLFLSLFYLKNRINKQRNILKYNINHGVMILCNLKILVLSNCCKSNGAFQKINKTSTIVYLYSSRIHFRDNKI